MNLIGRFYHALEQKGRLAIPSIFRKKIGKSTILTRGLEGCLFLFPTHSWEEIISQTSSHPFTKKRTREWIRLLVHNAQGVEFDSQGRILITDHLRKFASLENNCVVAGSINYLEIWDRDTYHTYMDSIESRAEEIAESFEDISHE
ncbi:division/cell wall cluster transcriptional repressor MraZ [Patescibacteria group bacterium]